jgi:hypothetical protein
MAVDGIADIDVPPRPDESENKQLREFQGGCDEEQREGEEEENGVIDVVTSDDGDDDLADISPGTLGLFNAQLSKQMAP